MDPLSIIASIAGIASAGAQLSNTLFKLYNTVKNAPKEIQSVAIEMSGLTATLEHLRDIIRTGQSYAKPQFCDAVRHVVENIQLTQQEISKMVGDEGILRRVKWLKAARLLSDVDKHKVTLTLQIAILSAAVLVKSTNGRLSVQEKVENRFKAQAESLILAGQASFENHDEQEPIPDPPQQRAPSPPVRTSKRLPSPVRESEVPGHLRAGDLREDVKYNTPEFDPRWRGKLRLTRNETASSGFILDPRQHGPSPASEEPSMRYLNGGYGRPYGQGRQAELARPKFQKPDFVVLPRLDSADFETGPMTPKLDLMSVNLGIVRQGDEPIWDCDLFMFEKSYQGKAIMGALIGDKSARNPHGLDLAHTLVKGRSMKLVYIRGNDFGETWFINEQPAFLQFLHSRYLPQFYPVKETDERAMKEEYVAIGEEWASFEALQQLGLIVKRREEGRVLLDPSTTWSMIKELATTTLQLRSMRQRRTFTPTFYSPVSAFRRKHGVGRHSFVTKTDYGEQAPAAPDRRATVEDESEVDILNLPINEEPKKTPEATAEVQSKAAPSTPQPQISITPPSTPQQTSPDYLDTSEVASRVSSGSRLSSGLGSENTGWQDDGKTPLTPTDSGVGSSIVSGR
ncbi:hypothetical protein HZS61_014173 [Fusarium oxysporum f. sp. conglutinans]|uniref:Fungal N-terminal domain-containing protein n=1 Tax=Fusarium oxysporum f. sp. conglutinans TaxID=100902 RepID=A0A8H6GSU5_FUSOX|nr:hypothetical protein HZS61_014173 [Fusarium oxysporum f. sp. conglutinans]